MDGMGEPGDICIMPPPPPPLLPSSFFLSVIISEAMIRSSSCFDLDSPMALMSSKNSFERCMPDMVANMVVVLLLWLQGCLLVTRPSW